jgi:alpha-ribazole phosphatase
MRHCAPEIAPERCLGQLDVPLSALGLAHARELAADLKLTPEQWPDAIVCSDLRRATETAQQMAGALNRPIHTDARWRELDMGEFTGRTWADIHAAQPDALARWGENFLHEGPPGGESYFALQQRVNAALKALPSTFQRVLIVTHAGPIRVLVGQATGVAPSEALKLPISYGERINCIA